MARMNPLQKEQVPELSDLLSNLEDRMGFLSNDLMTRARKPEALEAFVGLLGAVNRPCGKVSPELKTLVNNLSAQTVGCQYCSAHTAEIAAKAGATGNKIDSIWDYERSPLFNDAERAALSFAQAAASTPNMVTDDDFIALREHYDDEQIVEILLVVCLSGFFTRWNLTMRTDLEHA